MMSLFSCIVFICSLQISAPRPLVARNPHFENHWSKSMQSDTMVLKKIPKLALQSASWQNQWSRVCERPQNRGSQAKKCCKKTLKKITKINTSLFRLRHYGFRSQTQCVCAARAKADKAFISWSWHRIILGQCEGRFAPQSKKKINVSLGFAMPFSSVCSQFALSSAVFLGFF